MWYCINVKLKNIFKRISDGKQQYESEKVKLACFVVATGIPEGWSKTLSLVRCLATVAKQSLILTFGGEAAMK